MNFDSLFHPYTLIFLVSFLMGIVGPHFGGRRKMMFFKFGADSLSGIYLFLMGGYSGACGAGIAGTGALIQALTPHHYLKRTVPLRIALALILSTASVTFSYHKPTDLLPIAMVVICRFGELQSNSQRIRFIYFLTAFPWILYHALNGFYLPMISTILGATSMGISLIRHQKALNRQATQQNQSSP